LEKKIIENAVLIPDVGVVDRVDGELVGVEGYFISSEERARRSEQFRRTQQESMLKIHELSLEVKRLKELLGEPIENRVENEDSFIWGRFELGHDMFPGLSEQDVARLLYLSTYIQYKTNMIVDTKRKSVSIKNIKKLMNLERETYRRWIEKIQKYKYIRVEDDKVFVNSRIFNKGKLWLNKNMSAVRIFVDSIRNLYDAFGCNHGKMGVLYSMIPFINPHFNCLSENLKTAEIELMSKAKRGKLAQELGYSPSHLRRLENDILNMQLKKDNTNLAILSSLPGSKTNSKMFIVNPEIYYGGDNENYQLIKSLFENYDNSICLLDSLNT